MSDATIAPLEFMDLPLDDAHPVVWAVNTYAKATGRHYDIHAGLEIGIVLKGKSRRLYRQHEFNARPGDFWLVAPWESHGVQILQPHTHHLVLGILPEFLGVPDTRAGCDWMQIFRSPAPDRPRVLAAEQRRYQLAMGTRMAMILKSTGPFRLARLRMILQEFLLHLMETMPPQTAPSEISHDGDVNDNLLPALRLVERDPGRKITLADAARAARMSRTRFALQFHSFTGLTFARYLMRRRLRGVVGDLRVTDYKLRVIARRWGFADSSHLVRIFHRHLGCTPEVYRRRDFSVAENTAAAAKVGTMPKPGLFV